MKLSSYIIDFPESESVKTSPWLLSKGKRIFDIVFSIFALICMMPFWFIIAVLIKVDSSGEVFFSQIRIGKDGKPFRIWKFRTMHLHTSAYAETLKLYNQRAGPAFKMENDPRITKTGFYLRKHKLDELPQFINVLLGNMSVVGPRPPLRKEVDEYSPHDRNRLRAKPGLTCYWQVEGDGNCSWDEWVCLDCKYISHASSWEDIKLVLKTILVVCRGRD